MSDHPLPGQLTLFDTSSLHRPDPARLLELKSFALKCTQCALRSTRTQVVFGAGNPNSPPIAFIGEAPGELEDGSGRPFEGAAGQLLDNMLKAMSLTRDQVYMCTVVSCRIPIRRPPSAEELFACRDWWVGQLRAVQPLVIVTLGATATAALLEPKKIEDIGVYRKKWHMWQGIPLRATYHPSFLARNPADKTAAWVDLQEVLKLLKSRG